MSQCSLSLILCNFGASFTMSFFIGTVYTNVDMLFFAASQELFNYSSARVSIVLGPQTALWVAVCSLTRWEVRVFFLFHFIRYESCADLHRRGFDGDQYHLHNYAFLKSSRVEKVPRNRLVVIDTINAKLFVRKKW